MTSPQVRNRVLLTSQGVTALVAVAVNLLAFAWIPSNWQLFLWVSAAIEIVVLLPLLYLYLPESPRWLEAHGRHDEAERVMAQLEQRCQAATGQPLPAPNPVPDQTVSAAGGSWTELFTDPVYRGRTWLLIVVWLLAYAGLIYGVGAFAAVYMVDHGATAHFVFLTVAVAYAAQFVAFQINARLGETVERRDVLFAMGMLFAVSWAVAWMMPNLWVIAGCYVFGRIGTGLFLFNLYNYTAIAYPTRIRSKAFAWTDGLGHLGAWAGVTLLGPMYAFGPDHLGWIIWIIVPGALLPAMLIRFGGIRQSHAVLEQIST